jgi:hypothetical protein
VALETQLRTWSASAAQILPVLGSNGILSETVPVAQSLDTVCQAGLEALIFVRNGKSANADRTKAQLAFLAEAGKPKADLLIQIVPGVKKLVEAAGR